MGLIADDALGGQHHPAQIAVHRLIIDDENLIRMRGAGMVGHGIGRCGRPLAGGEMAHLILRQQLQLDELGQQRRRVGK